MNPITPKNIHRHELIGLNVEIIKSTDKQLLGLKGQIIDETRNMLVIQKNQGINCSNSTKIHVQKKICSFRFTLSSGEVVDVEGSLLDSKSENRIKNIIRKRW